MQQHVISIGFDPRNVLNRNKDCPRILLDEQAIGERFFALQLLQHRPQAGSESVRRLLVLNSCPAKSFAKTLFADGLEKVIESMHLEGAQRKPVMRRDEDHARQRNLRGVEGLNHAKAILPWHLHVEKNYVGTLLFNRRDGCLAAVGFAGNLHRRLFPQQPENFAPRRRFVVNDEHAEWRLRIHSEVGETCTEVCRGTRSVTSAPPLSLLEIENCCRSP